jgi:His/Glu/Gln/Arg/opine family amino acid ABC transporter permease subunit
MARALKTETSQIPFYRNVKTLGILAQVIFMVIVCAALIVIFNNVRMALARSNLPANFSFLGARAGIPIAESPITYSTSDPYWRAILIGFLKTLQVALVGVVLASLLGILVGVMRLSGNWLIRQIATIYVEVIRNTPLAVQIIFWFTAVLTPLPPRISNPIELPGGFYFSNLGLAMPWLYPTYAFQTWLPWLIAAFVVLIGLLIMRKRQIARSERPGNPWSLPLLSALGIIVVGYIAASLTTRLPDDVMSDFRPDRARGTVFIDSNQNGVRDANERVVPYAATLITIPEGRLNTTTQNLTESRGVVNSTFRFSPLREGQFETAEVTFVDPVEAEQFAIHFLNFPSAGLIYRDLNNNGEYDTGEEIDPETGRGYNGIALTMQLTNYSQRVVADREGTVRVPAFQLPEAAEAAPAQGSSARALFAAPAVQEEVTLEAEVEILPSGPLVLSVPSIPTPQYFGGVSLSASYLGILLALVTYTAGFIAEIVRGGIQAVNRGQSEAAKALGLSGYQTFSLIIFPQALRIILPPMISQYLNLTKNSSLGNLAAFTELFAISIIVANQTGASVPVTIMIIASYLLISLTFAFILNIVNDRFALVER